VNTPTYKTPINTINSYEVISTTKNLNNKRNFSSLKTQDLLDSKSDYRSLYTNNISN